MKVFVRTIIFFVTCCLLGSCCSGRSLSNGRTERDSTKIEVRTETVLVTDTVLVEIPAQTAERTTTDSVSHLENDYAVSDAIVSSEGILFHYLATKPQKKPVEFQKPVEHRDSIVYVDRVVTKTDMQIVEVAQKRTWWEQTRIYGFYLLVILLVISYRKQIGRLFIKLISCD